MNRMEARNGMGAESREELVNRTELEDKYRKLYLDPEHCEPLVQISFPVPSEYSRTEQFHSREKMLSQQLLEAEAHTRVGDDYLSALRVNFGTAQIAASFGCGIQEMGDSLPACKSHVLDDMELVSELRCPTMKDGLNERLMEYQEYFMKQKPSWIPVQHPDVQSAFNSAHLIRGNDILYDFYDYPDETRALLAKVTDFMLLWIREVKGQITQDSEWFYDMGGLWKGGARISDCSLQFLSPELYREFVRQEDERFLAGVGGGRVHYCGSHGEFLPEIWSMKSVTSMEIDSQFHDIYEVCSRAPRNVVMMFCDWSNRPENGPWLEKLLRQGCPEKRNIVIQAKASGEEEAKRLYEKIKRAVDSETVLISQSTSVFVSAYCEPCVIIKIILAERKRYYGNENGNGRFTVSRL